jgi:hypothetical protein
MRTKLSTLWHRHDGRPRLRAVLVAATVIAVVMAPVGVAATGSVLRAGKRNFATSETKIVSSTAGTNASVGGYATRQSNISDSGGGAIYGCRSGLPTAGGPAQEPCLRANNLRTGKAFEFAAHGELVGTIESGVGGDNAKPFTTNATGVATGLNADRVDSKSADDIVKDAATAAKSRWVLIDGKGAIVEQSGGFKVIDAGTPGFVYVDAGSSLENHGLTATIAAPDALGSDSAVSRCGTPAFDCVPAAAKNANSFVVATTDKAGTAATQRTYVTVTG